MEDKKMPFAVFVLQWVENKVKDYEEEGLDCYDFLDDLITSCADCPFEQECDGAWVGCKNKIMERVERAE